MKRFIAWMKSAKWILYLVLTVAVGVLMLTLRHMFFGEKPDKPTRLPDVPDALRRKVEKVEEEALVAKAEARVTAEADKKEIEEILKIDDGVERRRQLADKLRML